MNLDNFKNKLEKEKARLETELAQIGRRNPSNPVDWEPMPPEMDTRTSEQSELADKFEEMENRSAVEIHLEEKLGEVNAALNRIEKGKYGICEICGEKINEERMEANPSAATCVKHSRIQ